MSKTPLKDTKAGYGDMSNTRKPIVMPFGSRRLRVVQRHNIWTDREFFYPEERPKWWPFWFRFENGQGEQVFFPERSQAWSFLFNSCLLELAHVKGNKP